MKEHHSRLTEMHAQKTDQKRKQVRALFGVMEDKPMFAAEFRDEFTQAWHDVFAEELPDKVSWNWIRFGMRQGLFSKDDEGRYFMVKG